LQQVLTDVPGPNGLAFSPDESVLYIVASRAQPHRQIWGYDVSAQGQLSNKRLVIDAQGPGALDGIAVDREGNLWCGWGSDGSSGAKAEELDGVRVFAPDGTAIGHVHLPERCANLCFGGAKRNRLFICGTTSLYAVYLTPVFDTLVRYHWGHELMAVHFLLTGYLFYWGIIGVDPGPRRLPFIGRLALLFAIMPFHAFFGIAMMTQTSAVGGNYYRMLDLPWVQNLSDDQRLGGAIAWGASEVPLVMVVIALVTQWARQDRRTSTRSDRHSDAGYDDDMDAYNNMLRELARQRTSE
jgi:putative copper resistance protein D